MITTTELQASPKAFEKAGTVKPAVFKREGKFLVNGANDIYEVSIKGGVSNAVIDCDCPAGKLKRVCYHSAAAFQVFLNDREAAAQTEKPAELDYIIDYDFESEQIRQAVTIQSTRAGAEQNAQIDALNDRVSQLEKICRNLTQRLNNEENFTDYLSNKYSAANSRAY